MQRSDGQPADGSAPEPRACLDEQEVVDFAGGLLPAAKMASVEAHLGGCDRCTALVAAAAPHLSGGAAAPAVATRSLETQPLDPHSPDSPVLRGHGRDRPRLAPGTLLDATYQVVRFLGRGGMGDVYEVRHARLAGRYAAKLLSIDLVDNVQAFSRFQREATIASGLSHPNIVNVIDFCHLRDGLPCLVMEYLDGVDLADVMSRGAMSLVRTLRLVRQIVSALGTLHGHQIIHRDLKPQNIFVLPETDGQPERVKLVDFGLAKRSNPSMVVTHDRTLLGTPQYMAPEQAIGNADSVGPESDQFSLAAIVYEMLAGRHPFAGEVLSTVLYRIVHEPPAPLAAVAPDVPAYVVAAIERALSKDRQARFPSVKAFLQALEGEGVAMTPAPLEIPQHRPWFLRREVLASAGLLAAAAVSIGVFRMARESASDPAGDTRAGANMRRAEASGPREAADPHALSVEPRLPPSAPAPAATAATAAPATAAIIAPPAVEPARAATPTAREAAPRPARKPARERIAAAPPIATPETPAAAPAPAATTNTAPPAQPAPADPKPSAPLLIEKL